MSNSGTASIILCAPGYWKSLKEFEEILGAFEIDLEEADDRMEGAFEASACSITRTLGKEEVSRIASHASVAYVLSNEFLLEDCPADAHTFLKVARELIRLGALGIKCESSGISHSLNRWTELADRADLSFSEFKTTEDEELKDKYLFEFWESLFDAYTKYPISAKDLDSHYTCGMHLLGWPEVKVSLREMEEAYPDERPDLATVNLMKAFCLYLLVECHPEDMKDGQTFRITNEGPAYTLTKEPCTEYDDDDLYFNPLGYWRLSLERG